MPAPSRHNREIHSPAATGDSRSVRAVAVPAAELDGGLGVLAAFVRAELAKSNGEARRQIRGGAIKVNDVAISDEGMVLTSDNVGSEGVIKLSFGKKRHALLEPA